MLANVMLNLVPAYKALTLLQITSITELLAADALSFSQARKVLEAVDGTGKMPLAVARDWGMLQSNDTEALAAVVDEVLGRCEAQVQQYRDGNKKVVGFLVGQCMKASKGAGNPKVFNQLLVQKLEG